MSQYHLPSDTLAGYAAGTLSEGVSLLAASHLTYCAECRAEVARFEAMGGAVLESLSAETSSGPSLEATLALIEEAPEFDVPAAQSLPKGSSIPKPILAAIGADEADIKWKFKLPGIYAYDLDGYDGEKVQLLRAVPGATIPSHTHEGEESTLLLTGKMKDGDRVLGKGDVVYADHQDDHMPNIIGDEVCICLIVMSGKLKFTGPLSRALNLFG